MVSVYSESRQKEIECLIYSCVVNVREGDVLLF